jgi:hypothetical protein
MRFGEAIQENKYQDHESGVGSAHVLRRSRQLLLLAKADG